MAEATYEPFWSDRWSGPLGSRILVAVGLGALAFDLVFRAPVGLVTVACLSLLISSALVGGWVAERPARICLVAAVAPMVMLLFRASWWLVPLNVLAVVGLVVLATELRDEDRCVPRALGRMVRPTPALFALIAPPVLAIDTAKSMLDTGLSAKLIKSSMLRQPMVVLRGLCITAPVVVILLVLLAWSDAIFGSLFMRPSVPESVGSHGSWLIVGAFLMLVVASRGLRRTVEPALAVRPQLRSLEVGILFGATAAIYALFVAVQLVAALGGSSYVQRTTGLTVAEYARSGFFQLLAAAAFTLGVLMFGKRHAVVGAQRVLAWFGLTTVALTLSTVAIAVRRLLLYEQAFGLTMLRLYTIIFALWIGVVFVLTGFYLVNRLRPEHLTAVLASAFFTLLAVNIVNPEALVAERNISRFSSGQHVDVRYLVDELGPDAVPTVLGYRKALPALCAEYGRPDDRLLHFNWSRIRAKGALDDVCPQGWGGGSSSERWIVD